VEAGGGVPGRDADIGQRQLLLLGRQGSDGEHCRKGMHFEVTIAHGHSFPSVHQNTTSRYPMRRQGGGMAGLLPCGVQWLLHLLYLW
jgi:hypothetical protein